MFSMLKSLIAYRGFIISSIVNEFKSRFARSKLGGLWMIINPLAQVAIFTLILSKVLAAKLPGINNEFAYALYLMAGTLAWTLFSEVVGRCLNLFIDNGNLMKKMMFPRITLPAIVSGACLLNNTLLFVALLAVFALLGQNPAWVALWLIPLTLATLGLSLGLGLILGVLNVFVRDIGQVVPILLQMLFWFTPIVYPVNIVPSEMQSLLAFNPLFPIVSAYHDVLVYQQTPDIVSLAFIALISLSLLVLGLFMFRRSAAEMADVL
tara:strand:+ start:641 stop:1435 length:795 start_codon:yes stop_codon:yes gene_type:complete